MPADSITLSALSPRLMWIVAIAGFIFAVLSRVEITVPVLYYPTCILSIVLLYSPLFLPRSLCIYPFLVLIVNMADLTQSSEQVEAAGEIAAATPWQFFFGHITPAIFIFFSLFITTLRLLLIRDFKKYNGFFLFFFIISTASSLFFGFFQDSIVRFIIDAKIPMFFCTGLVLFGSYFNRFPGKILLVAQVLFALALGNFALDLLKLLTGYAGIDEVLGYRNLSLDSGKGLVTIFFFYCLSKILEGKKLFFNLVTISVIIYLLISYQTRWLIITLVAGLLIVSFFLGFRRVLKVGIPVALFLLIAIPVAIRLEPDAWKIMMLRFSFVEQLNSGSGLEDVEVARAGSIYNSMNLLYEKKAFLTGLGYGSWFTDSYFPMPNLTTAAFDASSLDAGKYYRVHDFTFHFLFKFGIAGLLIYIGIFVKPLRKLWKLKEGFRQSATLSRTVAIILIGISPMVITNLWFTGKGLLFSSLYVVFTYTWLNLYKPLPALKNARPAIS